MARRRTRFAVLVAVGLGIASGSLAACSGATGTLGAGSDAATGDGQRDAPGVDGDGSTHGPSPGDGTLTGDVVDASGVDASGDGDTGSSADGDAAGIVDAPGTDAYDAGNPCGAGLLDCGGSCTNPTVDVSNCGYCGHDCYGLGCSDGVCGTTVLGANQGSPYAIAVDSANVYWDDTQPTQGEGIMSAPLIGGPGGTLATASNPLGIAIDGTRIYWVDVSAHTVSSVPLTGAPSPTVLVAADAGASAPYDIAVHGTRLFFTDYGANALLTVGTDGTGLQTLTSNLSSPMAIAVDATNVYWIDNNDSYETGTGGLVKQMPAGGGNVVTLVSNENDPSAIRVDATTVYWADHGDGTIVSAPIGSHTRTVVTTQATGVYRIALDDQYVYFGGTGAVIGRVPKTGGPVTTLAIEPSNIQLSAIAVDDAWLYWANSTGASSVLKTPK